LASFGTFAIDFLVFEIMKLTRLIFNIMIMAGLLAQNAFASDWPQFRGLNRDGKSPEQGLLTKWPEGGPKLLWSAQGIGKGYTHVSIANGLVYVTGLVGKEGIIRSYTLDGKLVNEANYGPEWSSSHPGSRSIPTVLDGKVYLASGVGNIICLNAVTLKQNWFVKLFEINEAPQVQWGYAESLLIVGENIIAAPCGKKGTLVALNRNDGQLVWPCPIEVKESSYCSPTLIERQGRRMVVTLTDSAVIAVNPEQGKLLWQHPYQNPRQNHCVTPIYYDGQLYVTSGYGKGAIGLSIADDGHSVKKIWEQPRQDPVHGQAVLVNGHVYASSHQKASGRWSCVEFKTGKLKWEDACIGKGGSVVYADGMLYCYSEDGVVGLVRPNPEKCQVVSTMNVPMGDGPHWAHPVVAHGRLLIRHGDALMCYDIAAK
jgi:outer membrane protein assembly factor BamB